MKELIKQVKDGTITKAQAVAQSDYDTYEELIASIKSTKDLHGENGDEGNDGEGDDHIMPKQCGIIHGVIVSIGEAQEKNTPIVIKADSAKAAREMKFAGVSTVQHDLITIWLNNKLAKKAILRGMATIGVEQRLADITSYKSKAGDWINHNKDHCAISGYPTFEELEEVSKTKATMTGKFDWLQEVAGLSKEDTIATVRERITF